MSTVLQQGQADGLCGLYAALNFLNRTEWKASTTSDGLWYLLDACRHFGWLTPQHITEGLEDHQLKAILDLQFRNYGVGYEALLIRDVVRSREFPTFRHFAMAVLRKRGSLIAQHKENHWLLITRNSTGASVLDSANSKQPPRPFSPQQRSLSLTYGLVLLPKKLPSIEVDL